MSVVGYYILDQLLFPYGLQRQLYIKHFGRRRRGAKMTILSPSAVHHVICSSDLIVFRKSASAFPVGILFARHSVSVLIAHQVTTLIKKKSLLQ